MQDSLSEGGFARAAVSEKDDVANIGGTGHFRISKKTELSRVFVEKTDITGTGG